MRFGSTGARTFLAGVLVLAWHAHPAFASAMTRNGATSTSGQAGTSRQPQISAPPKAPTVPPGPIGDRSVLVRNQTDWSIVELYASPQSSESWGQDRLGDDQLGAGGQRPLRLGRMRDCGFDLLAIYDNLRREERRGVDLCHARDIVFDGSHASMPIDPAGPDHTITLANDSRMPIQQLFLSPPDAAQWGDDRLTTAAISVGEQRALHYQGGCTADVRVVFANRAAEERRGLDLCAFPTLHITPGWTTQDRPDTRD